jgi:hypothetical protein
MHIALTCPENTCPSSKTNHIPIHAGLAQDSRSVSVLHHGDVRSGIPERFKHVANCSTPRIAPAHIGIFNKCIPSSREKTLEFGAGPSAASLTYAATSTGGPAVLNALLLPFDANAIKLLRGQEVASPVLNIQHTPGTIFTRSLVITLPMESAKVEWFLTYEAKRKLAAVMQQRREDPFWDAIEEFGDLAVTSSVLGGSQHRSLSVNTTKALELRRRLSRRALLQAAGDNAHVEMMAVWYNNATRSWTRLDGAYITEVICA